MTWRRRGIREETQVKRLRSEEMKGKQGTPHVASGHKLAASVLGSGKTDTNKTYAAFKGLLQREEPRGSFKEAVASSIHFLMCVLKKYLLPSLRMHVKAVHGSAVCPTEKLETVCFQ